jgi:hypothetical protein
MKTESLRNWKSELPIITIALFSIIIHLVFMGNLEYHRDEMLYFSLGQHPDLGYATVPPLIGWIAWIMQKIFGYSVFAVRLFPALISGVMVLIVSETARELGGKIYARILAATGLLIAIFSLRTFSLFQPVHIDMLFWTLVFYLVIRYINSEDSKYIFRLGIVAGVALLNKYLIGLLFIILLLTIPFTVYRMILRKKVFWTGIAAGFVIFLPNLIWQALHGFPLFNHLSELADTQLVNVDRGAFLVEQLISPGAASFLTIAGLIFLLFNKNQRRFRFLAFVVLGVILSLMLLRGKSYYTQGVFPLLIAAGAVSYETLFRNWYTRLVFASTLVFITILIAPFGIPVFQTEKLVKYFDNLESKKGFDLGRTFEDGSKHSLPQDYADMLGWEELTSITNKAWVRIQDKKAAFIYCENYGQAGAITIIGKKYGLPEAVSFHESFRYWIPDRFDPDIKTLIYINDEPGDDIRRIFQTITEIGKISNPDAREYGTGVFICENPVGSFNKFWAERLEILNEERR